MGFYLPKLNAVLMFVVVYTCRGGVVAGARNLGLRRLFPAMKKQRARFEEAQFVELTMVCSFLYCVMLQLLD